ncbi:hypothetical protein LQW54_009645 [Pestalotiopsis sp. IQ-011]
MDDPAQFRAVIIGGGLVGLTAAHIFSQVGIDFVVLEKHNDISTYRGTDLAVWPQTLRLFDQLGLLETAKPLLEHISKMLVLTAEDGRLRRTDDTLEFLEKNHGHGVRLMSRPKLMDFVYSSLPQTAKDRILLGKQVSDIDVSEDGVNVACADGTCHSGSIIIGADGVRSRTRLLAQSLKAGCEPDDLPEKQKTPFVTTYRMYFADIPLLPGLAANTTYNAIHHGVSIQTVCTSKRATFGLFEKLDAPTSVLTRYTEADRTAMLERWGHLYVAPGYTAAEVCRHRIGEPGMIDLEEGLVDQWYHKRIVLVGDAVRKLEPHVGLGYNCGVTDLVVLVNQLRRLLRRDQSPSTPALEKMFESYQQARAKDTLQTAKFSEQSARLLAWLNWKHMVIGKYGLTLLLPLAEFILRKSVSPVVSKTPVLEGFEEKNLPESLVKWEYHPKVINGKHPLASTN